MNNPSVLTTTEEKEENRSLEPYLGATLVLPVGSPVSGQERPTSLVFIYAQFELERKGSRSKPKECLKY
jgi:hypothetical protein